ncbi:competence damage-inducible protein A [Candidatus Bathyarchaeota archaeon]|nr:MAG: competence damage-inducible protein A [Candidatus Bathyarchaeota archaeon]
MRLQGGYSVEIIATGDEILFGRIVDTNSSWIARRASEIGARLRRITCVGDDVAEIAQALREALARDSDLVIFTGGLGPSEDDVTVQAIGRAVGRRVELDPEEVERIRARCAELGVDSTPRREQMARILEGSKPLPNIVGMATGMMLREGGTTIVALPGVPEEMKAMFDAHVAPMIEENAASRFLARTVTVRIVWKDFFPLYRSTLRDFPDVYLKNEATPPLRAGEREKVHDIKVDIVVEASSKPECERKMDAFLKEFRRRIEASGGELITG